ncbi:hypothetical protein Y032_0192g1362 [Ancylostoma ceylanicum]|uniref:Uncharacterized protein n=1 Tax=Ancylostoma ceylanicum TaxID=53326 RepID=A0A016SQL8_9BILA|nr:hypothetical protein Y032_0192g1362 [Ancylostoma ceylanicum]
MNIRSIEPPLFKGSTHGKITLEILEYSGIKNSVMSSRAGLQKTSKRLAPPRSSVLKRRRMEEEAPLVEELQDGPPTSDEEEECPVAIGTPDRSCVMCIYERRKYSTYSVGQDDTLFCRLLNRRVDPSRLADRHWRSCGNCVVFSQPRENHTSDSLRRVPGHHHF